MFKCKECGTEYDIKPDFCDCGNDTFEEVAAPAPVKEEIKPQPQEEKAPVNQDFHKTQKSTDIASSLIFLFFVTLAVIVIFFIGNPKQENITAQKPEETQKQVINLPSIESLWNSSTVGIINNEKSKPKSQQVAQTAPQQPVQQQPTQVAQVPAAVQKPQQTAPQVKKPEQQQKQTQTTPKKTIANIFNTQPKQTTTTTTKTTTAPKTTQTTTTTTKPNIPKTTQAIANGQTTQKTTTPATTKTTTTQTQTQTKPVQTATQTTTKQTTATQTNTPKTTTTQNTQSTSVANVQGTTTLRPKSEVDTQALKKELDNYKIGLRNTIGRKIDFANVIGDGDCTVSFKVASNGKITNRAFAKQSTNVTLNDAVYSAVMSTPSYNPPPTAYNNETMNLHIKFYNGNFDISLN